MKKTQKGFTAIELVAVHLIIGLLGLAGWYIWSRSNTSPMPTSTSKAVESKSTVEDATFSVVIEPSVGGGIRGAVSSYEITSTGNIYHAHSPDYKTSPSRDLIKMINKQEVQALRDSFISSGVLDIASGDGPKYGGSSWKVTIDGQEKTFYDQSSPKFANPKAKLKSIFGNKLRI